MYIYLETWILGWDGEHLVAAPGGWRNYVEDQLLSLSHSGFTSEKPRGKSTKSYAIVLMIDRASTPSVHIAHHVAAPSLSRMLRTAYHVQGYGDT